ncbi:FAD:protein FMN transferase [Nocardioides sp. GY 10127]|uniref:FAD:protein FMN transferase n=1 Tax=Nocardioides sp. GY 10127 TaxID=2569762 RepID=UPI0010A77B17|nr:FAD:protein FMN transferase [Nocardioides sp. GY 10127]TIC84465.1 FAD:protein FMN transferase [Nocardioides sp. GY 10127]
MTGHARWSALGCGVHLVVLDDRELAAARRLVEQVLRDVDEVASRFRADSDLSRANAAAGRWVPVDPLLVAATQVAVEAARLTDGLVHPLLGRPLAELGYDADLGVVRARPDGHVTLLPHRDRPSPPPLLSYEEIGLDQDGALRVPSGTALDLGATGKAWCADLAASAFASAGLGPAVVSVGGDVRVHGERAFEVAVAEAPDGPPEDALGLADGGLATSTTTVRRWRLGGVERHHLLDPRSGLPVSGPWRTATVAAPTAVAANTATTAALVLGADAAPWLTARPHLAVAARLVGHDGQVHRLGSWPREVAA